MTKRVVLITGASSGIGQACSLNLLEHGFRVYGTSRRDHADGEFPYPMLTLDLAGADSAEPAIQEVLRREGRLDVLVNNAGMGIAGPIECTPIGEARRQFEANFFSCVLLCEAALPVMRRQSSGYIVNIGSIAGLIGLPYQAMYSASKFALEGFSEALRLEVRRFGIRVVVLEPGDHRTAFTRNRYCVPIERDAEDYRAPCSAAIGQMEHDERRGASPEKVARLLHHVLMLGNPRLRYTAGPASQRVAAWIQRFLPNSLIEQGMRRYYHLGR